MSRRAEGLYVRKSPTRSRPNREVWIYRWKQDGRFRQQTIGDCRKVSKRDAERLTKELCRDVDDGTMVKSSRDVPTLRQYLDDELATVRTQVAARSHASYENATKPLLAVVPESKPITAVDHRTMDAVAKYLAGKGRSNTTVANVHRHLRRLFRTAVKDRVFRENPFADWTAGRAQPKPPRVFLAEEQAAMVEAAPDQLWRALLSVAFCTGMRLNELAHLQWTRVNLVTRKLSIYRADAGMVDTAAGPVRIFDFSTKSYHDRVVRITTAAAAELERLRMVVQPSPYCFLPVDRVRAIAAVEKANGGLRPNYSFIANPNDRFTEIQTAAAAIVQDRVDHPIDWRRGTMHDCRKTFATVRAINGDSLGEIRADMGHRNESTTRGYIDWSLVSDRREQRDPDHVDVPGFCAHVAQKPVALADAG